MAEDKSALIAMSGGVDSSAAAWLMLEKGWRCMGATMQLWQDEPSQPGNAGAVAQQLGIPFETLDLTERFEECVVRKFIKTYESGETPNPCVDCNRSLKFGALLDHARMRGYCHIVTGHYARIRQGENGRWLLQKALDAGKDQSYVLYALTQDQLAHTLFPLGELRKEEVRALAARLDLASAHARDSQDICFVPDRDYAAFMERHTGKHYAEGDFVDLEGKVLGRHRGAVRYTLGQRRGLGLPMGDRVYVCGKDMSRNTVTVGPESALYTSALIAEDINWIAVEGLEAPLRCKAKTRYRQAEQDAVVSPLEGDRVRVDFDAPQRAVTPGQALVLYDGDIVVGGGTILHTQ